MNMTTKVRSDRSEGELRARGGSDSGRGSGGNGDDGGGSCGGGAQLGAMRTDGGLCALM